MLKDIKDKNDGIVIMPLLWREYFEELFIIKITETTVPEWKKQRANLELKDLWWNCKDWVTQAHTKRGKAATRIENTHNYTFL